MKMMRRVFPRYRGGELAPAGSYWNPQSGEFAKLDEDGGRLPQVEGEFFRGHPAAIMVVGPLLGLLYLIFLPLSVPIILGQYVAQRTARGMALAFRAVVR
jgi:hypothetical protein